MIVRNLDSRRKISTLSNTVGELLVKQISHELFNHDLYRTFANYYKVQGLQKLEKYYIDRANEELVHHRWIVDRLNQCDYAFSYPDVLPVEVNISNRIVPFELTVEKEIETTELIQNIATQAMEEKDWITFGWLYELLLKEQHEEEYISRHTLKLAEIDTDWLTIQDSIIEFYENKEL